MIPIAKPFLDEKEINAVADVLKSGMLAQGKKVKEFEEKFAEYIGVKYAISTNNGTTALHTSLLSAGIGKDDEIITTPFSFIASSNSILYTGAKPVFVDIREDDFNINPDLIEEKITSKTKGILIVHLYGQPCDMKKIMKICNDNDLILIEDACQAHGAEYDNKRVGSFGTGCFSFYPTKNMTTGEGGMITTNDEKIAETMKLMRDHGAKQMYYHEILGYNYRMTDIGAAIGLEQLKKLDKFNEKRIENANYLTENLKDIKGLITPETFSERKHVFHQYTIKITEEFSLSREEFIKKLEDNGIGTRIYYPLPVHKQKLYKDMGYNEKMPVSERMADEVLSLPIYPSLTEKDLNKIIDNIKCLAR